MRRLSLLARAHLVLVLSTGAVLLLAGLQSSTNGHTNWLTFAILSTGAAVAQLFPVYTPNNQAYYLTLVFIFAGVLALPPGASDLLIVIAFLPEWVKHRYPWYIPTFNIANFVISASLARALFTVWVSSPATRLLDQSSEVVGAVLAVALFTLVNHGLLAGILSLARGQTWRETGRFRRDNLLTDGMLASMGIIAAQLCLISPWVAALITAPLVLVRRALDTPNLQEQARIDAKTGLFNTRYFAQAVETEFKRARRLDHPVSVVMADLDLLRNINNTYGHLAGDVVLKGVATIIKGCLRDYDVAARFGGEEFVLLLPGATTEEAMVAADRIRRLVEEALFPVATSAEPIRATLSLGVASRPDHGNDPEEIIHQADMAVYWAKLQGRNRVWACSPESRALAPEVAGRRLAETVATIRGNQAHGGQNIPTRPSNKRPA